MNTPTTSTTNSGLLPPNTREAQLDEEWSMVYKKQANCDPNDPADMHRGDDWDHIAHDPEHRLVVSVVPGARGRERRGRGRGLQAADREPGVEPFDQRRAPAVQGGDPPGVRGRGDGHAERPAGVGGTRGGPAVALLRRGPQGPANGSGGRGPHPADLRDGGVAGRGAVGLAREQGGQRLITLEAEAPQGRTVRRLPQRHERRYVSIFGELTIDRVVYGTREGQKIERAPLDERLALPEGDFSYVLEDWGQRLCLKGSFAEAGESLEMLLGLRVGSRALEQMNRVMAGHAPSFQDSLEVPRPEEEGPLMVVTADGKGVPMRRPEPDDGPRPHHRRTKGEKANKKRMACVGAVYSFEPFVRKAEDIIDEVLRDEKAEERPRPQHKHVWALYLNDQWGEFHEHRVQREQDRLYTRPAVSRSAG